MGDAGEDKAVDIGQDLIERFAGRGWVRWQPTADLARLHLGKDGQVLDSLLVVGDPVDQGVAVMAEVGGGHMVGLLV